MYKQDIKELLMDISMEDGNKYQMVKYYLELAILELEKMEE